MLSNADADALVIRLKAIGAPKAAWLILVSVDSRPRNELLEQDQCHDNRSKHASRIAAGFHYGRDPGCLHGFRQGASEGTSVAPAIQVGKPQLCDNLAGLQIHRTLCRRWKHDTCHALCQRGLH